MESDVDSKYEGEDIDFQDEFDELAELPPPKKAKSKSKTNNKDYKRRTSSI